MNHPMPVSEMQTGASAGDALQSMPANMHRFARPGQRPLVFSGSLLAMAMSFTAEIPYWYEVNIFRTSTEEFALVVKLFFQSEEEEDYTKAWMFGDLGSVFDALESYDAATDMRVHMPELQESAPAELVAHAYALQAQVAARRAHWASLVGELLAELEDASQGMT